MKKSILNIMLCTVVALPFTACSTTDDQEDADAKKLAALTEVITEGMQNSDEVVALTAKAKTAIAADTRGAIESDEVTKVFETPKDYLGIMMLAQNILLDNIKDYPEYQPYNSLKVNWNSPKADPKNPSQLFDDTWSVPLRNTPAQALKIDDDNDGTMDRTYIELNTEAKNKYYPMGAYHNYWFYGYGPRQESLMVSPEGDEFSVLFNNLDGSQDVIYGKADPAYNHVSEAYSARWFRYADNRTNDVSNPVNMSYEHKMMQIRFNIKAGGLPVDESVDINKLYEPAYNTRIVSIQIINAPQSMQLILANNNKAMASREGMFVPAEGAARDRKYTVLNIGDSFYPQPTNPAAQKGDADNIPAVTQAGEGLLLPVLDDYNNNPYLMRIVLEYPKNSGIKHELKVPMRLPIETGAKLEAGKIYDVILEIFAPEEINSNTTLEPWVESTTQPFIGNGVFPVH